MSSRLEDMQRQIQAEIHRQVEERMHGLFSASREDLHVALAAIFRLYQDERELAKNALRRAEEAEAIAKIEQKLDYQAEFQDEIRLPHADVRGLIARLRKAEVAAERAKRLHVYDTDGKPLTQGAVNRLLHDRDKCRAELESERAKVEKLRMALRELRDWLQGSCRDGGDGERAAALALARAALAETEGSDG